MGTDSGQRGNSVNMLALLNRYRIVMTVAALCLLALAVGGYFWSGSREAGPSYREVKVARGDLEQTVLSTGVAQPRNRLEIKPPIPGRVEAVLIEEGNRVRKGTILAWMSSSERAALLDAARAKGAEEVRHWEELYRATPILAPIDGTVILRNVEPGQSFTSNDAVFVMSDRLIVVAQVDETDIAQIKLRQPAHIVLDAYPETAFDGKVDQIAFDAKTVNNVTTYLVDVLPVKAPAFMRSGMTANVSFQIAVHKAALFVPGEAIRHHDGKSYVLKSAESGTGQIEQEIEAGFTDGKRTQVISGLTEGETLLVPRLKAGGARNEPPAGNPFMPGRRR